MNLRAFLLNSSSWPMIVLSRSRRDEEQFRRVLFDAARYLGLIRSR